jgi:histidine triad (HIT) family protein
LILWARAITSYQAALRWALVNMSFALPVKRIRETKTLIAFHHPKPSYPFHVLLIPKRDIRDLASISSQESDFLVDLFETVGALVREFNLQSLGYRLIANGGPHQDFPLLHFHLISEKSQPDTSPRT